MRARDTAGEGPGGASPPESSRSGRGGVRSREEHEGKRKLLRGRYVVTDPSLLPASGMLEDGAVLVRGGEVEEVGEWRALRRRFPDTETFGSGRHLVLPGFVNAHHHGRGLSGVQLGIPDDFLERWILDYWRMPPLDLYLDTLYSNLRMIRSGVTAVLHSSYAREWGRIEAETRQALRAHADAGLRVAYAVGFEDRIRLVFGDQTAFLASLPAHLAERARALLRPPEDVEVERYFSHVSGLLEQSADNPALRVLHGPSWHVWCSRRLLERIAGDASDKDLGIHLHVLESPLERAHARRTYGTDCVSYLAEIGILGPKTSLAHGTWLSESDIERCAASGTSICHNPSCNLRLRNGIAPVARMMEAGVNVGIGMDSWGMSSDDDLLSELRLAAMLHRLPSRRRFEGCPDPFDLLRMLTVNGARAATFGGGAGRLRPGSPADAVLLDFDRMTHPYLARAVHPVTAFVHLARVQHIDTVVAAGEVLFHEGRFTRVDAEALERELAAVAAVSPDPAFRAFSQTLEELGPHLTRHYEDWPEEREACPFYFVNERG